MSQNKLGFTTSYTVNHFTSIKPTPSGSVNGDPYKSSVKLRTSAITLENDEKLGLVEKETNIEFTIYCEDGHLRDFNMWLRKKQKDNVPVISVADLPYGKGKEVLTTKAHLTGEEMMFVDKK